MIDLGIAVEYHIKNSGAYLQVREQEQSSCVGRVEVREHAVGFGMSAFVAEVKVREYLERQAVVRRMVRASSRWTRLRFVRRCPLAPRNGCALY